MRRFVTRNGRNLEVHNSNRRKENHKIHKMKRSNANLEDIGRRSLTISRKWSNNAPTAEQLCDEVCQRAQGIGVKYNPDRQRKESNVVKNEKRTMDNNNRKNGGQKKEVKEHDNGLFEYLPPFSDQFMKEFLQFEEKTG